MIGMLEGIKVLDLSRYLPGPFATLRLAEMGAEVVKVEAKPSGDPARGLAPYLEEVGAVFLACNRGKKSVAVNMRHAAGVQIVQQLMEKADVVLESYRPGVADQIGLGYEQAKQLNPNIIYCSLSGYGQNGKLAAMGGHDINYLALSGVLSEMTEPKKAPGIPGMTIADLAGGMAAVEAILAAIIKRDRKGEGSYLDISLTDTLLSWQVVNQAVKITESGYSSLGGMLREAVSYHVYETKDQRYMALGALEKKFWIEFCMAVGKEDWIGHHLSPAEPGNPIFSEVQELFRSRDYSYWYQLSFEIDACLTPVLTTDELSLHPYVQDRELIQPAVYLNHELQTFKMASKGLSSDESNIPSLGQHSKKVLRDWLEMEEAAIEAWEKDGVI